MFSKFTANDTLLRIVSVIVAVFLWMYVVGVRNPQVSITVRGVEVNIVNSSQISNRNLKVIEMSQKTVDVKVTGRRTDVAQISSDDLDVYVDAKDISRAGEYNLKIVGETNNENVTISSISAETLNIYIDKVITVEKPLEVKIEGNVKQGYVVGEPSVEIKNVMIQGPQSVVESVGTASVSVNISSAEKNIAQIAEVKLFGLNGSAIDMSYITLDNKNIAVKVPVHKSKDVKVSVETSEADKEKYTFTIQPDEIKIYGAKDVIDSVDEIKTQNFKVSGPGVYKLGITVPEGVYLSDDITTVSVTVTVRE